MNSTEPCEDISLLVKERHRLEKRIELYLTSDYYRPHDKWRLFCTWGAVFLTEWRMLEKMFNCIHVDIMGMSQVAAFHELLDEYNIPK